MATPAWLNDDVAADVATKVAKNPAAQSVAMKAAQDPSVQKAMINQVKKEATPDWAQSEKAPAPAPAAGPAGDPFFGPGPPSAPKDVEAAPVNGQQDGVNPYGQNIPPEDIQQMKKYHLFLRISYVLGSILLAISCGVTLSKDPEAGVILFCLYGMFFALLMFAFELHWAGIGVILAANFGFLYSIVGRWVFLLFVGFMQYQLGTLGIVTMSVLYAIGFVHLIFYCRFPYFPEYQRKLHYEYLS